MNLAKTMLDAENAGCYDMAERLHSSANRQSIVAMALAMVKEGLLSPKEAMAFKPQAHYAYRRPDGTTWLGGQQQ